MFLHDEPRTVEVLMSKEEEICVVKETLVFIVSIVGCQCLEQAAPDRMVFEV